jgi:hypothetical protein
VCENAVRLTTAHLEHKLPQMPAPEIPPGSGVSEGEQCIPLV